MINVNFADLVNLRSVTGVLTYGTLPVTGDIPSVKHMMISKKQKAGHAGDTMRQMSDDVLLIGRLPRARCDEKLTVRRSRQARGTGIKCAFL